MELSEVKSFSSAEKDKREVKRHKRKDEVSGKDTENRKIKTTDKAMIPVKTEKKTLVKIV